MRHCRTSVIKGFIVFLALSPVAQMIKVKITKLECEEYDPDFATFGECQLKAKSRAVSVVEMLIKLHKKPVNNITMNAELFQKGQGYRPFMYNSTLDFCRLMRNARSSVFWMLVFKEVIPFTNINHSCPIDHDIIVTGLSLKGGMFEMIPFPVNDYMFRLKFAAYKKYRFEIRAFVSLND